MRATGKRVAPGSPGNSPAHDRHHPKGLASISISEERTQAVLDCSAAAILESTSQERARKLHEKQVRLLEPVAKKRATMIQQMGNRNGQRFTVRQFARKTGQF